ncbi:MAG: aspartyl protease family protein [Candidatus Eremiobacteraeota bacterium]|nr:aspartyl protease family protein [Candidatus Eremiobacteraeota bacterium]
MSGMSFVSIVLSAVLALAGSPAAQRSGDAEFARGHWDAALTAYAAQLARAPHDPDALRGLGTIYLYRNDLRRARTYLTEAARLNPDDMMTQSRLRALTEREPSAQNFRITMPSDPVRIPFVATDPLPLVRAKIDGKDALLVLDTGGGAVDLTVAGAKRLGVASHVAGIGIFAGGKKAEMRSGRIDRIDVAGLTVRGIPCMVTPEPLKLAGRDVDGSIGTIFLRHFLSTIDYPHGALILRRASDSAAFERTAAANGSAVVPMWLVSDHFIFAPARVNDAADALFSIDTGGEGIGVQLSTEEIAAAKVSLEGARTGSFAGGGGAVRTQSFTVPSVSIGSFTERNVPGLYFPDANQFQIFPFQVGGLLSHEFFRHTELSFDFEAMKLVVTTPTTGP